MKDSLLVNKLAAAILLPALLAMCFGIVSRILIKEPDLSVRAYPVDVVESANATAEPEEKKALELVAGFLAASNIENGQKLSKKCTACHSFNEGGATKVGPNLYDVIGHDIGKKEGFKYSKAMAGLGGSWDFENLSAFIAKPKEFLPGTKMNFAGFKKVTDRADMIAYLRSLSANPKPLP